MDQGLLNYIAGADQHSWTALMYAAEKGHHTCIDSLLESDETLVNDDSCTALMLAAINNQPACIQKLLADVVMRTTRKLIIKASHDIVILAPGSTALMCAAACGHIDCVDRLVEQEGGQQNDENWTALMFAAHGGHTSCVKRLLDIEKTYTNKKGQSALDLAILGDHVECIDLLFGSEFKLHDTTGTNLMEFALRCNSFRAATYLQDHIPNEWKLDDFMWGALSGDIARVSAHKAQYSETVHGFTALMLAAGSGHALVVSELLQNYTQKVTFENRTALMLAARGGHTECVRLLAQHEAGKHDYDGWTALMHAAWNGTADTVRALIDREQLLQDSMGWTALMIAVSRNNASVIPFLLVEAFKQTTVSSVLLDKTYPPGLTALMIAMILGHINCISILIEQAIDLVDAEGHDARYYASARGLADIMPPLRLGGADSPEAEGMGLEAMSSSISSLNFGIQDRKVLLSASWTSLMFAAFVGKVFIVRSALEVEAGKIDTNGRTALMLSTIGHTPECAQLLVPYEAKMRDFESLTALMMGARKGYVDMIPILAVEKGMVTEKEVSMTIGEETFSIPIGSPAIMFAVVANHPEFVAHLAKSEANIKNAAGMKAYDLADKLRRTDLVDILRDFTDLDQQELSQRLVKAVEEQDLTFIRKNIHKWSEYDGHKKTALMCAAELGLKDFVDVLCQYQSGCSMKKGSFYPGYTALMFAVSAKRHSCIPLLIKNEAGRKNSRDMTALMMAAYNDDAKSVEYLKSELGIQDNSGVTALMYAAFRGSVSCIQPLLSEAGQMTKEKTRWPCEMPSGITALMLAVIAGKIEVVDLLKGKEMDVKDSTGKTALKYAEDKGQQDIVNMLRGESKSSTSCTQKGSDTRSVDSSKSSSSKRSTTTPTSDCQTNLIRAVITNDEALFNACIASDNRKQDKNRRSALMHAAERGHVKFVDRLKDIEGGMQIRKGSYCGYTALMSAAKNGHTECVKLLIDKEMKKTQSNGVSALMLAAANGHTECVKLLLPHEAGFYTTCGTALIQAIWRNHRETAECLYADEKERTNSDITELMWYAYCGDVEKVKEALKNKENIMKKSRSISDTALIYAAGSNSVWCVKLLIKYEAGHQNSARFTALMHAADCNAVDCVKLLRDLEKGMVNYRGYTALMLAAEHGYVECVQELLEEFDTSKSSERNALTIVEEKLQKEELTDEERGRYELCREILCRYRDEKTQKNSKLNQEGQKLDNTQEASSLTREDADGVSVGTSKEEMHFCSTSAMTVRENDLSADASDYMFTDHTKALNDMLSKLSSSTIGDDLEVVQKPELRVSQLEGMVITLTRTCLGLTQGLRRAEARVDELERMISPSGVNSI